MYLKEIGIKGFKSFANKIKLNITPGITVIVGPNGCGKSNIIDAVRWLLGEQSIRSLRGARVTDMIFSGNKEQKMKNYAQVSMLFDNSDRLFSLDTEEVEVKRIVYRSGDIENYINGVPCKLKDIQELFLGVGLGKNSYSIIAQNRTSFVLNAKPAERRMLFEEASDVAVYRAKKENALKKLEATENNLLRINDILFEVGEVLARSKKKFDDLEIYKSYQDNVRKLEYYLFCQQFKLLQRNINRGYKKVEKYKEEITKINKNLLFHKNKIAQIEQQRGQAEGLLNERLDSFQKNEIDKNNFINQMSVIKQKGLEIQKYIQNNREISIHSQKQYNKFQETLLAIEDTIKKNNNNEDIFQKKFEGQDVLLKKYNTIFNHYDKELVKTKDISEEINAIYKGCREEKIKKETEIRAKRASLCEVERESNYLLNKINNSRRLIENLKKELLSLKHQNVQLANEKKRREKEISEKNILFENERNDIKNLQNDLLLKNKEMDFIEEVLKVNKSNSAGKSDFFSNENCIPDEINLFQLKSIIKEIPDNLKQLFNFLLDDGIRYVHLTHIDKVFHYKNIFSEKNNGRLDIIADNLVQFSQNRLKILKGNCSIEKDKVIGFADKLISYPSEYKKQVKAIFGHILIVKDKKTAFKIAEYFKGKWTVISLDGVFINERGIATVNIFLNNITKDSYQISKKKCQELKQNIEYLAQIILKKELLLATELEEQKELCSGMKNIDNQLEKNILNGSEKKRELTKQENNIEQSENLLNSLIAKKNKEIENIENIKRDTEFLNKNIDSTSQQLANTLSLVDCLIKIKSSCQKATDVIIRNKENCKREISWNREKEDFLHKRKREMVQFVENYHYEEQERKSTVKKRQQELHQLNGQETELREKIDTIMEVQNRLNNFINETKETIKEQETLLKKMREKVDEELIDLEEKKNACHADEMTLVQNQEKLSHLLQTIKNQYDTSIDQIIGYGKHANSQTEALEKISDYKERIKMMGQINFNAYQEYKEQSVKYEELLQKKEEITESKEKLTALISEIDRVAEDHFCRTFHKVQENFQETFSKLFQGGWGSLELSNDKKPLEAGIEVLAQPPGKQVQNISLLSAGEKTLTAVALLFALWKTNPTPFCFFDEIDSGLDEANAIRLASYIKDEDLKNSQIVIITHQKEIMKIADALYGITMDKFGTSKLMSVRMTEGRGNQD
ncbi:MAG: chromosome segregation protein SMC [Candidatus Atribacteria bacterium]|nr:chromosome segregation protein SMC [Candidatus Atribacteria bacterium]